jgi:hypothetical protein
MRSKTLEHADYFVLYITCGLFCFTCGLSFFYLLLADYVQPGTRHADYSVLPGGPRGQRALAPGQKEAYASSSFSFGVSKEK